MFNSFFISRPGLDSSAKPLRHLLKTGNLLPWAKQGILLLNATLTVRAHEARSHQGKGWEEFTDAVIELIGQRKNKVIFLLWGGYARKKKKHMIFYSFL